MNFRRNGAWHTNLPVPSTTGSRRNLVSSNSLQTSTIYVDKRRFENQYNNGYAVGLLVNLAASSRLVVSRTTRGAGVITSLTIFPFVLLNNFWISLNVCKNENIIDVDSWCRTTAFEYNHVASRGIYWCLWRLVSGQPNLIFEKV